MARGAEYPAKMKAGVGEGRVGGRPQVSIPRLSRGTGVGVCSVVPGSLPDATPVVWNFNPITNYPGSNKTYPT